MFKKITENIWTAEQPQSFFGLELGARMTVIDLGGQGNLLIHSPIRPTPELVANVKALGRVSAIVAPNLLHHLYAGEFKTHFPEAALYGAPGLDKKRKDLSFDQIIRSGETYPWSPWVKHGFVQGIPYCNEIVFFVPEAKTLIVTDLGLHICEESHWFTKLVFKSIGLYKKFGWSLPEKWLFIRNKMPFEKSVAELLAWDFDKIIMAHGRPVTEKGHAAFEKAFS